MRIGENPTRDRQLDVNHFTHQVIIPVFIPNFDDYYKDSLAVLELCLSSVVKTSHSQTLITVVNNGSCEKVVDYLNGLFSQKKIHEIYHTQNVGKLNAILKGLVGSNIELVTISDADVLFLDNWQSETVKVFNSFPKAGVVGIVPQFRTFEYMCGNLILQNIFSKDLRFSEVKNIEGVKNFYKSIGWEENYNQDYLKQILTLKNEKTIAVVGSGHFVATYKREIFKEINTYFDFKLGGNSERYLDEILLKFGLWRLTTYDNFAYHMGNESENWMKSKVESLSENSTSVHLTTQEPLKRQNKISYFIYNKLFIRLLMNKSFRNLFYKMKQLPKEMIPNYSNTTR